MVQKREGRLGYIFLGILFLGIVVMLFERPGIPGTVIWPDILREIMGFGGGMACLGLLYGGWSKGKASFHELWSEMNLAQKSLAWLCIALALRSVFDLINLAFHGGAIFRWIIIALQVSGGIALALFIVPVMVNVYIPYFKDFSSLSSYQKLEKIFEAAIYPLWIISIAASFFRLIFTDGGDAFWWDLVVYISMWLVSVALLGLVVVKLSEEPASEMAEALEDGEQAEKWTLPARQSPRKKLKWYLGLALALLILGYASYSLIEMF